MNEDQLYDNLPADPEMAFLHLEAHFRAACQAQIREANQEDRTDIFYVEYISRVLAAIAELGLASEFDDRVPAIEDVSYQTYLNFSKDVEHYRTSLRIRQAKRLTGNSVRFDGVVREKISHYIRQIREVVGKLEATPRKKEALLNKLNAFQTEVDRERTRFESFAALLIEFSGTVGESAQEAEPARKWLDNIAKIIWCAKEEEARQFPKPVEQKRIEPPRTPRDTARDRDISKEIDDEIPF